MASFNCLDQSFFHRSLGREEFNLCLTIQTQVCYHPVLKLLWGTDTGNGESSSAGRWWSCWDEDVFFCLSNWLLSRSTGLVQTSSSTRHKNGKSGAFQLFTSASCGFAQHLPVAAAAHQHFSLCIWSGLTSQLPKSSCYRCTQPASLFMLPLIAICASSSGDWGWSTSQGINLRLTHLLSCWQQEEKSDVHSVQMIPAQLLKNP